MSRSRRHRLFTVLFALVSLLYMQLAVAAYACPNAGPKVAAMGAAGMRCAESMTMNLDDEQSGLCHAHCQASSQSSQTSQLPPLVAVDALPAVPAVLVAPLPFIEASLRPPHLQRTTAPPLAIRNCCFRL